MSEQAFDTQGLLRLLRRHRRMLVALTLLGALAAGGLTAWRPPMYSATSLVLIPEAAAGATAASGSTVSDIDTDSAIATSSAVLSPALAKVDPSLPFSMGKQRVHASSTAANIVEITANGTTAQQAERLANAVADGLVSFITSSGSGTGANAVAGLQAQATQLTKQINGLNQEIQATNEAIANGGPSTASVQQDTALLASLTTSQSNASLELATVNSEIATAKLSVGIANAGTEVIQRPTSASLPPLLHRAIPVVVGALIGFALGAVVVMARRNSRRVISREQIAEAAGVPVLLSSTVGKWRGSSDWLGLLRGEQPATTQRWNVRKALRHLDLGEGGASELTVISMVKDAATMAATTRLAIAAAAMDIRTSLVLTSDDESSIGLGKACEVLSARDEDVRSNLTMHAGAQPPAGKGSDADLSIYSVVIDPKQPRFEVKDVHGVVVLGVSAGDISADQIAQVLLAIGEEGLSVKGVFVTNPEEDDLTTGRSMTTTPTQRADQILRLRTIGSVSEWRSVSD